MFQSAQQTSAKGSCLLLHAAPCGHVPAANLTQKNCEHGAKKFVPLWRRRRYFSKHMRSKGTFPCEDGCAYSLHSISGGTLSSRRWLARPQPMAPPSETSSCCCSVGSTGGSVKGVPEVISVPSGKAQTGEGLRRRDPGDAGLAAKFCLGCGGKVGAACRR